MVDTTSRGIGSNTSFVLRADGKLLVDGILWRFASLNAPELLDGDENGPFEVQDTFRTIALGFARPVTRTYTLRVKSVNIGRGHINGWNSEWGDWEWDEGRFEEMDVVLDEASKAGVRLIMPIINQDFGGEDTNWVGNTTDLIRMRKGIAYTEAKKVDWWTDFEMIESFKLLLDKLLGRVNSKNGRKYGEDPVILAWETGNEMNKNGYSAPPTSWTLTVAKHIKSRARQLVMDGSFARTDNIDSCFPKAILESPDIDLVNYHYYGSGETGRLRRDCVTALKYGKVFVAGEYGFYDRAADYEKFLSVAHSAGAGGSLAWSLRPHSSQGGFKTHGEGNGQWSYHIPGWSEPLHAEFDPREAAIVQVIRAASFKINGERVPDYPVPAPPGRIWLSSPTQICWTGAAWASAYVLVVKNSVTGEERVRRMLDATKEGCLGVDIGNEMAGWSRQDVVVRMRSISASEVAGVDSEEVRL